MRTIWEFPAGEVLIDISDDGVIRVNGEPVTPPHATGCKETTFIASEAGAVSTTSGGSDCVIDHHVER